MNEAKPSPLLPKMQKMVSNILLSLMNNKEDKTISSTLPLMELLRKKRQRDKKQLLASVDTLNSRQSGKNLYSPSQINRMQLMP